MKREIKFRQKLKPSITKICGEEFHYWGYIDDGFISPLGKNEAIGDSEQYTGLTDKNGADVYEGDIVSLTFHADKSYSSIAKVQERDFQLEFYNENEFKQSWGEGELLWSKSARALGWYSCPFKFLDIEVIGNIYQNPELLDNQGGEK